MRVRNGRCGIRGRLARRFGGACALLAAAVTPLGARPLAPEQAPRAWVAYAEQATATVTAWLNGDEPSARRLRAAVEPARPTPNRLPPPMVVELWVDPSGRLSRVETASTADAQAHADLQAALIGRRLAPPPRRMRQPLRVALELLKNPATVVRPSPAFR